MKGFEIKRGDIFYIGKSPCVGSEQWGGRPGIVVSNEENNMHSETVEVVYCTTRFKPMLPTHTTIRSTPYDSTVLCEQVTTVSVERIGNYIGRCSEEEMRGIDRCILVPLGLSKGKEENPNPDYVPPMGNGRDGSDEEIKIRIERDTYRKMYEMAIERLAKMSENAGGALKTEGSYSIYCKFDADKHKSVYTNYLEVLISRSGEIMYAVPSHQEKAIEIACKELGVTRDEVSKMCPREYYFDFLNWLLMISGAAAVWNDSCLAPCPTKAQIGALRMLKLKGLYRGTIPTIK